MTNQSESSSISSDRKMGNALETLRQLKIYGFVNNFIYENGLLRCVESGRNYAGEQLSIVASYRFEGESNPDDSSILYALRATDGTAGTIMDSFGPEATPDLGDFLSLVVDRRSTSAIMEDIPSSRTTEESSKTLV